MIEPEFFTNSGLLCLKRREQVKNGIIRENVKGRIMIWKQ